MHQHSHNQPHEISKTRLLITIALNFIITIAEVIGGIFANSLALLSDALHNLSDGVSVIITYIANKVSKKKATVRRTFGFKRIEILAALFNAIVLIVISIYLFIEAFERFNNPEPIKGKIMFIVASIGLVANIAGTLLLKKDAKHNINVKASYLHLLTDVLSSIAVIIGGILIYFYEIYWIDPVLTFAIGLYIIFETIKIVRETVDILMQATPKNIDLFKLKEEIEKIKEIDNVHHMHAWNLNDNECFFEAHIELKNDIRISESDEVKKLVWQKLHDFNISHSTIQMEFNCSDDKSIIHEEV
jgi:cobalt-zinc-cadmium efflux system protein